MPAVSLVCPHCETQVQIHVTAVARSRPCPQCGNLLLLQIAEKNSGAKRKALLVAPTAPTDACADRVMHPEPQTLRGNVFGRMSGDPSVLRLRKRLVIGGVTVVGLITLLTTLQLSGLFKRSPAPAAVVERATAAPAEVPPPAVNLPEVLPIVATRSDEQLVPIAGSQFMALANLGEPREVLQKFLEAETIEDRLQWVAAKDEMEPLMRPYYRRHGDGPVPFTRIHAHAGNDQETHQFKVQFREGVDRTATLVKTSAGYRVDWPSFVGFSELQWDEFLTKKPTKPILMRVLSAPADHYAGAFGDADAYLCLQILAGTDATAQPVYGYVLRSSTLAREVEYWIQQAEQFPMAVTLRVKYPSDSAAADQVWITELVAPSWVVASGPAISRAP